MKKTTYTLLSIALSVLCLTLPAQTLELENKFLDQSLRNAEMDKKEVDSRRSEITQLLKSPSYPQVPYDTLSQNFDFQFVIPQTGANKSDLYRKILEWCAVKFVRENSGIRIQDSLHGKIIVVGYSDLRYENTIPGIFGGQSHRDETTECWYSLSLTITDGSIQGKFNSVEYIFTNTVITSETYTVYKETKKTSALCPINSQREGRMEGIVNLFKATAADFRLLERDLKQYLN